MAIQPLVTPKVARISWNDLTQQWHIHMSRQEKTGLGAFQEMDRETFATLAELIIALLQFWVMQGDFTPDTQLNARVGSINDVVTFINTYSVMVEQLDAPLVAATGPTELDPGVGEYDGSADGWGATPVGP